MKKSSHDIERFRQAATFLIQTFALLARAQFCLRQKPVWMTGSGIQKQKCANSCAANQRPAPKSSLDFCAAKCRPCFTGGKRGLRSEKRRMAFLVSPSAPQFWSRQKPCRCSTKKRYSVKSVLRGRTLLLLPAPHHSPTKKALPKPAVRRKGLGKALFFPSNGRFHRRENPPELFAIHSSFLHYSLLYLFAISHTAATSFSTSAAVLKAPRLHRTAPSSKVPSWAWAEGAQ